MNLSNDWHQKLMVAAIEVLRVLDDPDSTGSTVHAALLGLHTAVRGQVDPTQVDQRRSEADAMRHLVSRLKYEGTVAFPVTLDEEASDIRRQLANAGKLGDGMTSNGQTVVLTELRGMIIGGLLEELAARLRPGAAFGPSRAGEALADVTAEFASTVLDQTFVGRS